MSYKALNWAWEAQLPMAQKFVLVALADMADEKETCYPGQERLAAMTGTSVSTVRRAVKALEEMGAISRRARGVAGGGRTSDRYYLHTNQPICTVRGNRSFEGPKPVNVHAETGHSDRGTPREPSEEPSDLLSIDVVEPTTKELDVLWSLWPTSRRSTRKVVARSLKAALKVAPWSVIHAAAVGHVGVWVTWPESDLKFVPLLSTWLNQERWTGAVPEPRGGARLSVVDTGRAADLILSGATPPSLRALS